MLMVTIEDFDREGNVTVCRIDGKFHTTNAEGWCSVARYFGWNACNHCDSTDGSVDCEHHSTEEMLFSAGEFLSNNIGATSDDPGWWDN